MPKRKEVEVEDVSKKDYPGSPYKGTVRMVTEQDLKDDPRLIAASAVVGQLYDFSNLESIPEEAAHDNAAELNRMKDMEVKPEEEKV